MDRDTAILVVAGIIAYGVWFNSRTFSGMARLGGLEDAAKDVERAGGCGAVLVVGMGLLVLWVMGGG